MLLALLVYCYSTGRFSSRVIEEATRQAGKKPRGPEPKEPEETPGAKDQYNFTDPQSRIMKAGNAGHFEQCYNAQAAVETQSMLIVSNHLSDRLQHSQE